MPSGTRSILSLILAAALVAAGSCQRVGQPSPDTPGPAEPPQPPSEVQRPAEVAGEWDGVLRLAGDPEGIAGVVVIQQDGPTVQAAFSSPVGINASGGGTITGRAVKLVLAYDIECPGTLTLEGTLTDDESISGTVSVNDCTGAVEGAFELSKSR